MDVTALVDAELASRRGERDGDGGEGGARARAHGLGLGEWLGAGTDGRLELDTFAWGSVVPGERVCVRVGEREGGVFSGRLCPEKWSVCQARNLERDECRRRRKEGSPHL